MKPVEGFFEAWSAGFGCVLLLLVVGFPSVLIGGLVEGIFGQGFGFIVGIALYPYVLGAWGLDSIRNYLKDKLGRWSSRVDVVQSWRARRRC